MEIFGYNISKKRDEEEDGNVKNALNLPEEGFSPTPLDISPISGSFYHFGATVDAESNMDEVALVTRYREVARQPEFGKAIDNIVNDVFAYDESSLPVSVNLDNVEGISEKTKEKIREEFADLLNLLNFKNDSYDIFRRWYVDGRLFYHKVIDEKAPAKGIQQLRYIDPRKIRKVRNRKNKAIATKENVEINNEYEEFYMYNPNGINSNTVKGLPLSKDSICYIHSGILSNDNKIVFSHIHPAIRFFNSLRQLEDSVVIYRISKAAEKRVFNVEVGDLPKEQAENYMQRLIAKFRKKLSYNPVTGEVVEQKRFMTMLEDYWFAKRDGKGTTVDVLPGAENLGQMEDVEYFKRKLYESLQVPITRLDPTANFTIGRVSEISRDELNFQKFVSRLRKRFSYLFDDLLRTQLILKKVITDKEWKEIAQDISYDFLEDNHFSELKNSELLSNRAQTLQSLENYVGTYFSKDYVRKRVLNMSEEEIENELKQIEKEKKEEPDEEAEIDNTPPPPQPVTIVPNPDDEK